MKKAIIFDLDGTLVNSIPHYLKIHKLVLKDAIDFDLSDEYFYEHCNGKSAYEFYAQILKEQNLPASTLEKMKKLDKKYLKHEVAHQVKTFGQVKTILKNLKKMDVRLAVATSSLRSYTNVVLEKNNIEQYFDAIVTRDHIKESKPNPEIFLQARRELGIPKKDCVIVEDAINGFKAAKRAGMDCVGLTTSLSQKQVKPLVTKVANHKNLLNTLEKL